MDAGVGVLENGVDVNELQIGETERGKLFALPREAVTQTFGILAVRGAGKSNTAAVMAEEMFAAGLPFVVVDPVGSWWGLRSSGDGKGPGLPIPIFGGRHGDVPLEKLAGNMIADLVVDERLSCVLDCSDFSEGDKIRFLIDFAQRLYRRNSDPLHLFLEEADDYAPQRPFRDQAVLLRAWENVVRRGRARGLGITMITQRSAALNKNVLTQIETLIVLRTTAPNDRKAIEAWVDYHGQSKEIVDSLPGLAAGEAWIWSPSWLKTLKKVQIRRRATFDSGATPKETHGKRPPTTLAEVDLVAIQKQMNATVERAKAEDPRELRKQIADLKRQLAGQKPQIERVEVPVIAPAQLKAFEEIAAQISKEADRHGQAMALFWKNHDEVAQALLNAMRAVAHHPPEKQVNLSTQKLIRQPARSLSTGNGSTNITGPERKILTALVQHGPCSIRRLAILTGYAHGGGAFRNPLSALRSKGYTDGRETMRVTQAGESNLGSVEFLPAGRELREYWLSHLTGPEAKILRPLLDHYPKTFSIEDIAAAAGYEVNGGAFRNPLSRLRTLGLIEGRGEIKASDHLFE
jgi:hypothetical protein